MQWSDLIVISHLRWAFVWQRPQHLISRLADGQPTWFVEEPITGDVDEPTLRTRQHGAVTQVWLEMPGAPRHYDFDDPAAECYIDKLQELVGWQPARATWLYTPIAYEMARNLDPALVVYDVMDDLASFKDAPASLRRCQDRLLSEADVVFTGGRSLHRGVTDRRADAHCFPSGVESEHFAQALDARPAKTRPVAGYVGVIDERLDPELLAGLAAALPDWDIHVVGPVAKIAPESLPLAPNLIYPGPAPYQDLPQVMAGFDVALMPFALNEGTRSISPTKTLEYLAAGLPVVSTKVPDVVTEYGDVVAFADQPETFAAACRDVLADDATERQRRVTPLLKRHHWDTIANRMSTVLETASTDVNALEESV
ncbi:MAG TPA: glycosyltransferase [Acidimicrobiales bacterium]|nr:glycosyltransferase [Acidimicrobiales bacterium]